jgi:leader peptidase (prepilin peptidase) / N-methyltransferase
MELFIEEFPLLWIAFAVIWGGLWGSFLNVVVYRWPLLRSVVYPGSTCGACGVAIPWHENLPVLSCLLAQASCRQCGTRFSWRYMLVELTMACSSGAIWHYSNGSLVDWLAGFSLVFVCTAVFLTDLDHWIIPDELNVLGVVLGTLAHASSARVGSSLWSSLLDSLLGLICGYCVFWAIQIAGLLVAKQEAMGGGDLKFAAALGCFLGWYVALKAFFLSFLLGAVVAVPLMALKGRGSKEPIPFGTFMAVAAIIVFFWGPYFDSGSFLL